MAKPVQSPALIAAQEKTLNRLQFIQRHFNDNKGSGRMKGKVCIVTGVGSEKGIGRASAIAYAREGAKAIYILDYAGESLPALAKTLESRYPGVKVIPQQADCALESVIQEVCERAIKEFGRLDVFFANAGIVGANMLQVTEEKEFMEVCRVNTFSCFVAIKHASEAMKIPHPESGKVESAGSIILTASVAGMRSGAGPMDYSASKAGVINLAQTGCQTLFGTNIRVNAILPGLIETGMTTYTFDRARERGTIGKVGQLNPLRRFGVAEEIAQAALWLGSDDSSYVNGVALPVDGGLSSSHPVVPGHAF
ncbi:NAD-binding protein [Meredithblackwellia eburnea MCA 4105]